MNNSNKIYTIIILIIILAILYYVWPTKTISTPALVIEAVVPEDIKTTTSEPLPLETNKINKNLMNTITIETNKGNIVFETYNADAPKAVENFITLANKGYYNGVIFHRVIKGFMIQGGDPTGTGRGGPGYSFEDELNPSTDSYKAGYKRGVVAMANAGPNTNGSQFFIMHADYALPNSYTIFGKVISGMDTVDAIANTPVAPGDSPIEKVVMKKVTVAEKK
jgi:cyclophilin family peptidyl-prolyl cis-trans isomerase